ncbi:MAG: DUF4199 domain-containing protein [Cyclobacteriaceae bacterium]
MEETTNEKPSLMQHALKWGVIMGIINVVIGVLLYVVDYTMLTDWKTGILIVLLVIGVTIYAGINYRSEVGGFLGYGKAWQHGMIFMAVGGLVYSIYNLILYTIIDPELPAKLVEAAVEKAQAMAESFGASGDALDKAMEDTRKRTEGQFSVVGVMTGFAFSLIFYAIIALITALFVRKNQPEEI